MVVSLLRSPRILVLGLRDPSLGDEGIGVYLARLLRMDLKEAEVEEAPPSAPDFGRIFHDYDVLIVLDSISICREVGQVTLVSPYALPDLKGGWVDHARSFVDALEEARLHGRRIPVIHVVAVCVPDLESSEGSASPQIEALYRAVYPRVRGVVKQLLQEAPKGSVAAPSRPDR